MEKGCQTYENHGYSADEHDDMAASVGYRTEALMAISSSQTPQQSYTQSDTSLDGRPENCINSSRESEHGHGDKPSVSFYQDNYSQTNDHYQNSHTEVYHISGSTISDHYHNENYAGNSVDAGYKIPTAPLAIELIYPRLDGMDASYYPEYSSTSYPASHLGAHGGNTYFREPYNVTDVRTSSENGTISDGSSLEEKRTHFSGLNCDVADIRAHKALVLDDFKALKKLRANRTHAYARSPKIRTASRSGNCIGRDVLLEECITSKDTSFNNTDEQDEDNDSIDLTFIDRTTGIEFYPDGTQIVEESSLTNKQVTEPRAARVTREAFQARSKDRNGKPKSTSELKPQSTNQLKPQSTNQLKPQSTNQLKLQSTNQLKPQPTNQLKPQSTNQLKPQSTNQLKHQSTNQLNPQSTNQLNPRSTTQLNPQSTSQLNAQSTNQLKLQSTNQLNPQSTSQLNPQSTSQLKTYRQPNLSNQKQPYEQSTYSGQLQPNRQPALSGQFQPYGQPVLNGQLQTYGQPVLNGQLQTYGQPFLSPHFQPYGPPALSGQLQPYGQPALSAQLQPYGQPALSAQLQPYGQPALSAQLQPYGQPALSAQLQPYGQPALSAQLQPYGQLALSAQLQPYGQPALSGQLQPYGQPALSGQLQPYGQPALSGKLQPYGQPALSGQLEPYGQPALSGQLQPYGQPVLTSNLQPNGYHETISDLQSYRQPDTSSDLQSYRQPDTSSDLQSYRQPDTSSGLRIHGQVHPTTQQLSASHEITPAAVDHQPLPAGKIERDDAPRVPNYTTLSIFVTIFCCLPLGLVGLVKAREAKTLKDQGKYRAAIEKASSSFTANLFAIIFGIIIIGTGVGFLAWKLTHISM